MVDENAPTSEAPPEPPAPEAEAVPAAPVRSEEADWATRYKYLLADFDNFRKRSDRDRESMREVGRAHVLRAVVPLFEVFERAHHASEALAQDHPMRKGLELLAHEWAGFWRAEGVTPVARPGERFRSDDHEAVAEAPAGPAAPEGTVVEVVQQGYRFPGGLLRPAKVVVARRSATRAEAPPAEVAVTPAENPPSLE